MTDIPKDNEQECFSPYFKGQCNPSDLSDSLQTLEMQNKVELGKINTEINELGLEIKRNISTGLNSLHRRGKDLGIEFLDSDKVTFIENNNGSIIFSINDNKYSMTPDNTKITIGGINNPYLDIKYIIDTVFEETSPDIKSAIIGNFNIANNNGFMHFRKNNTEQDNELFINGDLSASVIISPNEDLIFAEEINDGNSVSYVFNVVDRNNTGREKLQIKFKIGNND